MANKSWTATDIIQGELTLQLVGDELHVKRVYSFVDDEGEALGIGHRKLRRTVDWDDVPTNIQSALVDISAWTKAEILAEEGME